MTTAADLIKGALRLIGQLAEGETPSNETLNDSLSALNQMLDAWSVEGLMVHAIQDQTVTWPANTATCTIGPTGDFTEDRPILIEDSTYFVLNGVSYPIFIVSQLDYNAIADKDLISDYPTFLLVNMTMPDATLTVYPVPSQELELHLMSRVALTQPATLITELSVPPGYMRAFRFNLAKELAAEFGKEPPGWVIKNADQSKGVVARVNAPIEEMTMPAALPRGHSRYNIYTDG